MARLGAGGMGEVFLAFSPGGQAAAVKVIRDGFGQDAEFRHRFAREVAAAQRVQGVYVAPLLDADVSPGTEHPWLATAYVAGPSLREVVVTHGALPASQVLLLAWGLANALTDIHRVEVVHRDLKPGNIMFDETGPKVIDFGIVKSLAETVTHRSQSTRIGTPLYMSPEQAEGRPVGASSDMFALGSILYYLVTAREAFGADSEMAVARRIVAHEPDMSAVPPPLRNLIARCLRKEPNQRPTPDEVREWCEMALRGAPGPGAWMRLTAARASIRQRTDALHAARATGIPSAVGSIVEPEPRSEPRPLPRPEPIPAYVPPAPADEGLKTPAVGLAPRRSTAALGMEVWLAIGALIAAIPVPLWRESRLGPGGQPHKWTTSFEIRHLWEQNHFDDLKEHLPTIGVIGTAAALGLVAVYAFWSPESEVLRGCRVAAALVFWMWAFMVIFFGGYLVAMTLDLLPEDYVGPPNSYRFVLLPGGWLLLLSNILAANSIRRAFQKRRAEDGAVWR
ncbi:serine/threonine-protein kinase [Kitasatospora sp. NPDC036755]|uniref:serine/threonine-protein kinase n=1 Tax=Kitasatospora sp. NPDC036755 TaxID=3154600 RepID=UPI003400E103